MQEVPKVFDWVTARSKCDIAFAFELLREIVGSDVKAANALGKKGIEFTFHDSARDKFIAGRKTDLHGAWDARGVVFELMADAIKVKGSASGPELFSAVINFTPAGECLLSVDGQMMHPWQVSQKALEPLFFGV